MMQVKLLRPLDGRNIGDTTNYPKLDAERLAEMGCIEIIGPARDETEKSAAPSENKMNVPGADKDVRRTPRGKAR